MDWLVDLEFNCLVNTIKVMSSQSVYLTRLFLCRLSPLPNQYLCICFPQKPKYWDIQARANSVDPDLNAASDQGLHCLLPHLSIFRHINREKKDGLDQVLEQVMVMILKCDNGKFMPAP